VIRDVRVFRDLDALSAAAAVLVIDAARQAIQDRGQFLFALSGGTTPATLYRLLGGSTYGGQMDWFRVHVFWGDERCVPPEDAANSYGQARNAFLGRVPVLTHNIHRIQSELDPRVAADNYSRVLGDFASPPLGWPRFVLVLLGLGEDGHTASLFPGSDPDVKATTLVVKAEYQDRPATRVTLTPSVFNSARRIVFLVSGASKAKVLARVLYGDFRPAALPAQRIQPADGEMIWMVDQEAASAA